jgi:hypothetical protein
MYEVHTYTDKQLKYRWGVVAENGKKVGHGGESYENATDMEVVLTKMFLPARGAFFGQHVPWEDCNLHESKSGKCYKHKIVDARKLVPLAQGSQDALGLSDL